MSKSDKILILIRHAHRDVTYKSSDNGLSQTGLKQALRLEKELGHLFEKEEPLFLSSPKKRCVETLEPLAKKFGKKVKTEDFLIEEAADETRADLLDRIFSFIDLWKEKCPKVTFVCSHGDWLPEAVQIMTRKDMDFVKSGWAIFTLQSDQVTLRESSENRDN
jgi:broad specificity phosphatase PhoE